MTKCSATGHKRPSLRVLGSTVVLLLALMIPVGPAAAAQDFPRELRAKLRQLDRDQRDFLGGDDVLRFLPRVQLEHEIAVRDPAALAALATDLMQLMEQMAFDPEQDMGEIPLNTEAKGFNGHAVVEPMALRETRRSPGPFSVHRYIFPATGIPTFAGAPVAITPEDLLVGQVDVAIVGIPNDMGSGRRNAEYGPRVMRALNTIAEPDVDSLVDPMAVLSVVDYGDFSIDNMSTERSIDHVAQMVSETASTGAVPMMVGGDTSMLYPGVAGVSRVHGAGNFSVVHFGAQPDMKRFEVHTISDTQVFFRLLDEGLVHGDDLIQVGLRGAATSAATLAWMRDAGVRYHTMAEVRTRGFDAVLARVIDEVLAGPEKTFVSIDVSVVEPAEMIAAGRAAAGGLRVQQVTRAIRHLCAARQVVGFEITDMAPMLDVSRTSAMNANAILNACLVGVAVRKAGLAPDYVNPLALDHGQD